MRLARITTLKVSDGDPVVLVTSQETTNAPAVLGSKALSGNQALILSVANGDASSTGTWEAYLQGNVDVSVLEKMDLVAMGESVSAGEIEYWSPNPASGSQFGVVGIWWPPQELETWPDPALVFHQTTGTPVDLYVTVWSVV